MLGRTTAERDLEYYKNVKFPHDLVIRRLTRQFKGQEVKDTGDRIINAFRDPEQAVLAALGMQEAFTEHPILVPNQKEQPEVGVCIVIHTGSASPIPHDYSCSTVDTAAGLLKMAHKQQVVISEETAALIKGKLRGVSLRKLRSHKLKSGTCAAFEVLAENMVQL